jgi:hypothetical protein
MFEYQENGFGQGILEKSGIRIRRSHLQNFWDSGSLNQFVIAISRHPALGRPKLSAPPPPRLLRVDSRRTMAAFPWRHPLRTAGCSDCSDCAIRFAPKDFFGDDQRKARRIERRASRSRKREAKHLARQPNNNKSSNK